MLAGLLRGPSLSVPPQQPAAGAAPRRKAKRTLNLSAGVLLTAPQAREEVKRRDDEKEAEHKAKTQRKADRDEKKAEKVKEEAVKAVRKAERDGAKVVAAAVKQPEAKKQKRKAEVARRGEGRRWTRRTSGGEARGGAEVDKENVSPNVSVVVAEEVQKPRYVCSVLRRGQGDVLRLRACV